MPAYIFIAVTDKKIKYSILLVNKWATVIITILIFTRLTIVKNDKKPSKSHLLCLYNALFFKKVNMVKLQLC